jgi:hypothetical protein
VRVDCVFFPAEVTSTAKPTEEQLEDFFRLHRSDFGPEADGDEFQAKNRGRIAQAYATAEAHRRSVERADEFLCRVYECPVAGREEKIAAIAAEFGRPIRHLEPYAATELVTDLPAELLLGAFALNGEHSFTDPCPGDGGTHVLLLRERVEPRDLPLEEVRDDVERRCHRQRRVELFAQRARDIQRKIRGQMAQGESFPVAAKAFGLSVGNCHTFSLEMPPDSIDSGELAAILNLKAGEVSEFVLIKPDLRLWHVVALEVPEMDGEDEIATAIAVENVDPGGLALLRQLLEERILAELEGSQR